MPGTKEVPKTPTRERRLYTAVARIYADAFREVFVYPIAARRAFRGWATRDPQMAVDALWLSDDPFGPAAARPDAAADAAFVYWTYRERRPRVLLWRAATGLRMEGERRTIAAQSAEARDKLASAQGQIWDLDGRRRHALGEVHNLMRAAERVWVDPRAACRAMLRHARKDLAAVIGMVGQQPETFGPLLTNRVPVLRDVPLLNRSDLLLRITRETTEVARGHLLYVIRELRDALIARANRPRAGQLHKLKRMMAEVSDFRSTLDLIDRSLSGGMNDAAHAIAVLLRRRAVDEKPEGKGPPPVTVQLAAMLPQDAAALIAEAVRLSDKHSGDEHEGWRLELTRGRDAEVQRSRGRGWQRERDRGLSL